MIDRYPVAGSGSAIDPTAPLVARQAAGADVHIAHSRVLGHAYERFGDCGLAIRSAAPHLGALDMSVVKAGDVVVVGCTQGMLLAPAFRARIRELAAMARVVAVVPTPTADTAYLAARAGFHGLVAREVTPDAFRRAVEAARNGELVFPRGAIASLLRLLRRSNRENGNGRSNGLTPRQRQAVELIARGATDREIAGALGISESTAHKHVQNALRRANAKTRSQLVARTHRGRIRHATATGGA